MLYILAVVIVVSALGPSCVAALQTSTRNLTVTDNPIVPGSDKWKYCRMSTHQCGRYCCCNARYLYTPRNARYLYLSVCTYAEDFRERSYVLHEGNTVAGIHKTDLNSCRIFCTAEPTCRSFTFVSSSGDCRLKDRIVTLTDPANADDAGGDIKTYILWDESSSCFEAAPVRDEYLWTAVGGDRFLWMPRYKWAVKHWSLLPKVCGNLAFRVCDLEDSSVPVFDACVTPTYLGVVDAKKKPGSDYAHDDWACLKFTKRIPSSLKGQEDAKEHRICFDGKDAVARRDFWFQTLSNRLNGP